MNKLELERIFTSYYGNDRAIISEYENSYKEKYIMVIDKCFSRKTFGKIYDRFGFVTLKSSNPFWNKYNIMEYYKINYDVYLLNKKESALYLI